MSDIFCALSGVMPGETEIIDDHEDDLPLGWTRVIIQSRHVNQDWVAVQEVKKASLEQLWETNKGEIPEDHHEAAQRAFRIQIDANYAALENRIPKFREEEEVAYIASTHNNPQLLEEYNKLMEMLDIESEFFDEEEDSGEGTKETDS